MITLSIEAAEKLKASVAEDGKKAFRIFVSGIG
jgi:Fe-S cluster assembly iron-binding protein IscA